MPKTDQQVRPSGPPEDTPCATWRRRLIRLRRTLQDYISGLDERFAAERRWTAQRSVSGWSVRVRDPRFDRRHLCSTCEGTGRHRIAIDECAECGGTGVVTDPQPGEQR